MAKHGVLVCLVMFAIILSFALVSANTLVGGKIYNSDFSQTISGASVSVDCGTDSLDTTSLGDGAYAVTFDSDSCYNTHEVQVSASKGNLNGEGTSTINNSTDEEGGYVAVANINMKAPGSTVNVTVRRGASGGFFLCGNSVCDSGETYATCPTDCAPVPEGNTLNPLVAPLNDDSGNNNPPNTQTQTIQATSNIPGITGAVTGEAGEGNHTWLLVIGILILLAIGMAVVSLIRGNMYRKKMGYI